MPPSYGVRLAKEMDDDDRLSTIKDGLEAISSVKALDTVLMSLLFLLPFAWLRYFAGLGRKRQKTETVTAKREPVGNTFFRNSRNTFSQIRG